MADLSGKAICVGSGTTTEQNLNDAFAAQGLPYTPIKYQDLNQVVGGYLQGRCAAMTSDRSQLASARSGFKDPQEHVILADRLSKEPLAPAVVGGDQRMADATNWVVYALIEAEERGITQANLDDVLEQAVAIHLRLPCVVSWVLMEALERSSVCRTTSWFRSFGRQAIMARFITVISAPGVPSPFREAPIVWVGKAV
jgi:hypothetical protein